MCKILFHFFQCDNKTSIIQFYNCLLQTKRLLKHKTTDKIVVETAVATLEMLKI